MIDDLKYIQVTAANGAEVIIFIDKITHIFTFDGERTTIKMINDDGILTDLTILEVLQLIKDGNRK